MRCTPSAQTNAIRPGFTLVEIMVAAALSVVIMTIIATAFQTGLEATSQMKSIGAIASQLRQSDGIMRSDLRAVHLWDENASPAAAVQVSGLSGAWGTVSTEHGFLRLQGTAPTGANVEGTVNGADPGSARATDHWMHFTVHLSGASPDSAFASAAPNEAVGDSENMAGSSTANGQFVSTWAEVAYFLEPMGTTTLPDTPGTELDLFTLRRRQRVIANAALTNTLPASATVDEYPELSLNGSGLNTPFSVVTDTNRLNGGTVKPTRLSTTTSLSSKDYRGSDIVLANVISMRIQVVKDNDVEFSDIPGGVYDTSTTTGVTIRAVRITLRIYDPKNRLTRQVSIDQAL